MIKIDKGPAPQSLVRNNNRLVEILKLKYLEGERTFEFSKLYRSDIVKKALKDCHYNKCCFSEAKFISDDSHVEHFRPKGRVDAWPEGGFHSPGYYWLAYEWDNLFLCKSTINSSYKRNFFPLIDGCLYNHCHSDLNIEVPLLVNPSVDDPRHHIRFKGDEPIGLTIQGKCTINLLNLRCSELEEARRTRLVMLKLLKDNVDEALKLGIAKNNPIVANTVSILKESIEAKAEFSSMARDFLLGWPHLQ